MKITLPDTIRSKKNSKQIIMVGGKNVKRRPLLVPSKAYQKWEKQARRAARMQYRGEPLPGPVSVAVRVYYKGRQPDLSGCLESIGDCLEGICWVDDKQIVSWDGSRLYHDLKNPRTEVVVNGKDS
jgi:Holliday junction resolvase RusA-like endonuclease